MWIFLPGFTLQTNRPQLFILLVGLFKYGGKVPKPAMADTPFALFHRVTGRHTCCSFFFFEWKKLKSPIDREVDSYRDNDYGVRTIRYANLIQCSCFKARWAQQICSPIGGLFPAVLPLSMVALTQEGKKNSLWKRSSRKDRDEIVRWTDHGWLHIGTPGRDGGHKLAMDPIKGSFGSQDRKYVGIGKLQEYICHTPPFL